MREKPKTYTYIVIYLYSLKIEFSHEIDETNRNNRTIFFLCTSKGKGNIIGIVCKKKSKIK